MRTRVSPENMIAAGDVHESIPGVSEEVQNVFDNFQKLEEIKMELQLGLMRPDALNGLRVSTIRDLEELQELVRRYADFENMESPDQQESLKRRIDALEAQVIRSYTVINQANENAPKN